MEKSLRGEHVKQMPVYIARAVVNDGTGPLVALKTDNFQSRDFYLTVNIYYIQKLSNNV